MNPPRHVSVFELDTWFASSTAERTRPEGLAIAAHVESCAECTRYLTTLEELATPDANPRKPRRVIGRLVPAAATALALAAGTVLYLRATRSSTTADEASYIGVKGTPAAQVLVRHEGQSGGVQVWDGKSPVRAGDALAVRVACEEFGHVAIVAEGDGPPARAWDGPCPIARDGADATLPFTLVVDDRPGREHFAVVFTPARLDDARLQAAVHDAVRTGQAWTLAFDFAKQE